MKNEILSLLSITTSLRDKYGRRFTLDGKLIGDIGEVLARQHFNIELHPENTENYDAFEIDTDRQIQIKTTMKGYFTFPYNHVPEYYLALKISAEGDLLPIFNGKGQIIKDYIDKKNLKPYRNSYYSLTLKTIKSLDGLVSENERITPRSI